MSYAAPPPLAMPQAVHPQPGYPAAYPVDSARSINRTPSPTPSEVNFLNGINNNTPRQNMQRRIAILIFIGGVIAIEAEHQNILNGLKPVTNWLHDTTGAWLVPIAVMFVLSFPPLFGHELVVMLCGVTWGIGEGFGIAAAGTIIGEIATFFVFRTFLSRRAKKIEYSNLEYGALAHVIREGGLFIAVVTRYSSIPGHLTTALFSTVGMPFHIFLIAAIVALPKQLSIVYVGYALGQDDDTVSNKIQYAVIGVTVAATVGALLFLRYRTQKVRGEIVYLRRKARQAKLQGEA